MTRTRYNFLRTMIRDNGWYALKWMPLHEASLFADLRIKAGLTTRMWKNTKTLIF